MHITADYVKKASYRSILQREQITILVTFLSCLLPIYSSLPIPIGGDHV